MSKYSEMLSHACEAQAHVNARETQARATLGTCTNTREIQAHVTLTGNYGSAQWGQGSIRRTRWGSDWKQPQENAGVQLWVIHSMTSIRPGSDLRPPCSCEKA